MNCPICGEAINGDGVCFGGTDIGWFTQKDPFAVQYKKSKFKRQGSSVVGIETTYTAGTICQQCYNKYFAHRVGNALQIIVAKGER